MAIVCFLIALLYIILCIYVTYFSSHRNAHNFWLWVCL